MNYIDCILDPVPRANKAAKQYFHIRPAKLLQSKPWSRKGNEHS